MSNRCRKGEMVEAYRPRTLCLLFSLLFSSGPLLLISSAFGSAGLPQQREFSALTSGFDSTVGRQRLSSATLKKTLRRNAGSVDMASGSCCILPDAGGAPLEVALALGACLPDRVLPPSGRAPPTRY